MNAPGHSTKLVCAPLIDDGRQGEGVNCDMLSRGLRTPFDLSREKSSLVRGEGPAWSAARRFGAVRIASWDQ